MARLMVILLLACLLIPVSAQTNSTAAVLTVRYAPVEVRRAGTEAWIALSPGAEMPFGDGDSVRTLKDSGRASLTFAGLRWLILPNSEILLDHYMALTGDEAFLEAHVSGVIVTEASAGGAWDYKIHTPKMTITKPGTKAALWTSPDWPESYIVAAGSATVESGSGETVTIKAGEGFYDDGTHSEAVSLNAPYNAARLQSLLYGCPAVVTTEQRTGLIVRLGPAQSFQNLDILLDDYEVSVVGQTEKSGWSRIQYLSGFGWMFSIALDQDESCTRTPLPFPDDAAQESIITAYNIDEDEGALLLPFFGDPTENYLFYRTK